MNDYNIQSLSLTFPVWYLRASTSAPNPGEFEVGVYFDKASGEHLIPIFLTEDTAKTHCHVNALDSEVRSMTKSDFVLFTRKVLASSSAEGYVLEPVGRRNRDTTSLVIPLQDIAQIHIPEDDQVGENV